MSERSAVLHDVMSRTHTTQSALSRISGVRQPSISQYLSGRVDLSDSMLESLLACMGYGLEVVRTSHEVDLERSSRRRWLLHRQLATRLTSEQDLDRWTPTIHRNLERLETSVRGQPHRRNLQRWRRLVDERDVRGIRRLFTALDDDAIAMREVSPFGGLLPQEERTLVLEGRRR